MKKLRSLCSGLLTLSLFFSMLHPLSAQNFPKYLEKDFRSDATQKVERAVKIYNEAKAEFEKKGAAAFVEKVDSLAPKTFTQSEKDFLAKKIAKELLLPTLLVKGDRLIGMEAEKEIFNLSTFEVAQGVFRFKEKTLQFNANRRLIENFESWTKSTQQSFLHSLFFPQAHAFSKGTGALVGALLGGVLAWFLWPKISEWFKGKKETSTPDTHSDSVAPLATEAPAVTPPPTTPDTAPAPAPEKPTRTAANTEKPSTEADTLKYINDNLPKSVTATTLDELEKLKDVPQYPDYVKALLSKIKSDIQSSKNDTGVKVKLAKVLNALINKNGTRLESLKHLEGDINALEAQLSSN